MKIEQKVEAQVKYDILKIKGSSLVVRVDRNITDTEKNHCSVIYGFAQEFATEEGVCDGLLRAIEVHIGTSATNGHNVAYMYNRAKTVGCWVRQDDDIGKIVNDEEVLSNTTQVVALYYDVRLRNNQPALPPQQPLLYIKQVTEREFYPRNNYLLAGGDTPNNYLLTLQGNLDERDVTWDSDYARESDDCIFERENSGGSDRVYDYMEDATSPHTNSGSGKNESDSECGYAESVLACHIHNNVRNAANQTKYPWGFHLIGFLVLGYCNVSGRYAFVPYRDEDDVGYMIVCPEKLASLVNECSPELGCHLDAQAVVRFITETFFVGCPEKLVQSSILASVPVYSKALTLVDMAVKFNNSNPAYEFDKKMVALNGLFRSRVCRVSTPNRLQKTFSTVH